MSVGKEIKVILGGKRPDDWADRGKQPNDWAVKPKLPNWAVMRYSNEADFKSLWKIPNPENGNNDKLNNGKIIIVWDGSPNEGTDTDSDVSLKQYITPIDWALAYSLKNIGTKLNIVILDVYSHEFEYKNEEMKEFHRDCLDKMKRWVKFYSFNKKDYGNRKSVTNEKSNKELFSWPIKDEIDFMFDQLASDSEVLGSLSGDWKDIIKNTAQADESRHSINNILDPMLLARFTLTLDDFKKRYIKYSKYCNQEKAFYNLFEWHGIFKKCKKGKGTDNRPPKLKEAKIVLIDDQEFRWTPILRCWIDDKIYPERDVYSIINILNNLKQNERFRLIENDGNKSDEILLFDLYLFRSTSVKERKYFSNVIELAKKLKKKLGVKILSSSPNYLGELKDNLDNLDNPEYRRQHIIEYLTLLPRLIASIDRLIPIIIFSSTEKALQLGDVKHGYKNIIDWFHKPAVLSDDWDAVEAPRLKKIKNNFIEKINEAMSFIDNNPRHIFFKKFSPKNVGFGNLDFPTFDKNLRVELYLDETGVAGISRSFTIGGIYIVGPDDKWQHPQLDALEKYAKKIQDLCEQENRKMSREEKKDIRDESVSRLDNLLQDGKKPFCIRAVRLTGEFDSSIEKPDSDAIKEAIEEIAKQNHVRVGNCIGPSTFDEEEFTDVIIQNIFRRIVKNKKLHPGQGRKLRNKLNREFNQFLKTNERLCEVMMSQYRESTDHHMSMLINLSKLFSNVMLPMLQEVSDKEVVDSAIYYGTLTRFPYLQIAQKLKGDRGFQFEPQGQVGRVYMITQSTLSLLPASFEYDPNTLGVRNRKFRGWHYIADAILNNNNLDKHLGMKEDEAKSFPESFLRYCYNNDYRNALQSLRRDTTWSNAIKNIPSFKRRTLF